MRLTIASTLLLLTGAASAASQWTFSDGVVSVSAKGGAEAVTEKFSEKARLQTSIKLGHMDTIKVALTAKDGSKAKRPHQAFLMIKEASGLEAPFPLTVKDSGKGTVEITQKDLPVQLLLSQKPLEASLVLGSFGSSQASIVPAFDIDVARDPNSPSPSYEAPLRYGKLEEIHHIFRSDPKSPPMVVSLVFMVAIVSALPALFIAWAALGANVEHSQTALEKAPVAHAIFFSSIVTMEAVFFLYYSEWNLFQTLPIIGIVGVVAFLSGTKALGEVQRRRLAGQR